MQCRLTQSRPHATEESAQLIDAIAALVQAGKGAEAGAIFGRQTERNRRAVAAAAYTNEVLCSATKALTGLQPRICKDTADRQGCHRPPYSTVFQTEVLKISKDCVWSQATHQ